MNDNTTSCKKCGGVAFWVDQSIDVVGFDHVRDDVIADLDWYHCSECGYDFKLAYPHWRRFTWDYADVDTFINGYYGDVQVSIDPGY
jgi:ribosomal protein L37E